MRIAKRYLTDRPFFHYMERLFYNLKFLIYLKFMCQAKTLGPNLEAISKMHLTPNSPPEADCEPP
jgi:hypothetical protein